MDATPDPTKLAALIMPGQGSQYVSMTREPYENIKRYAMSGTRQKPASPSLLQDNLCPLPTLILIVLSMKRA